MKRQPKRSYHWYTIVLSVAWHVVFFAFLAFPRTSSEVLGTLAWQLYVILLSFLASTLLMVYFLSLVDSKQPRQKKTWLIINSLLMCLPLYFLWWNYLQ